MTVQLGSAYGKVELDVGGLKNGVTSAQASLASLDKGLGGAAGSMGRLGTAAGTAGALITGALVSGVTLAITEAMEAERVMAQTEAVIRSTGGAAGLTADDIGAMAQSLSSMTTFSDDAVQSMQNILLTFPEVKGDVFREASMAVLDMSTALGTDLQGAAMQVGKALQDPIAGITALRRAGVNFSDDQRQVIKDLVETGRTAQAQKLILAELGKEFAGSAAAAAGTFDGKIKQLQNSLNNVAEGIGTAFIPILHQAADALDVLINGESRIQEAQSQHEAEVLRLSSNYQDYVTEITRANRAQSEAELILRDIGRGVATYDDLARAVGAKTAAEYIAAKASQTHAAAADQVKAAMERQTAVMGTVAAAHAQMQQIVAGSVMLAIAYTEEERKLAEKQQELETLNEQIAANGPRRVVMVQNEKMSAEELARTKLELTVATEKLSAATRKEGESDAEYELRLAGLRDKVADLSNKMGEHAASVGGATKAQQEHKAALEAEIAAMQNATWMERAKAGMEALTKAYQDGRLTTDEYLERATVLNRNSNLYSDSALKAATAQEVFIKALQDPSVTNYPAMMAAVKQGILDVGTSVETSGTKINKLSKQDLLDMGVEGETAANKVKSGAETAIDAVSRQVERTNAAIESSMKRGMEAIGTAALAAASKADGVAEALNKIPRNIEVKIKITQEGNIPEAAGTPSGGGKTRAMGGPVNEGWWYLHDDEYVLSKAMREGRQAIPAEAAPLTGLVGNSMTLMEGAVKVYAAPDQNATEIAHAVVTELGRMTNAAVNSGMGYQGL